MRMKIKVLCICMLMSFFFTSVSASIMPKNIDHQLLSMKNQMERQLTLKSRTIYVNDDNQAGPWDGSQDSPFQHIQDAVNAYEERDKILVYSGTYNESITIINDDREKDYIIIEGTTEDYHGKDTGYPKVYGNRIGSVFLFEKCFKPIISGFYISGSSLIDTGSGIKMYECISCVVYHNHITDCGYGIIYENCCVSLDTQEESLIQFNVLENNFKQGIVLEYNQATWVEGNHLHEMKQDAILVQNSFKCLIQNNNISNNRKDPIKTCSFPIRPYTYISIPFGFHVITCNDILGNDEECENQWSFANFWYKNYWGNPNNEPTHKIFSCFPGIWDHYPNRKAFNPPEPFSS